MNSANYRLLALATVCLAVPLALAQDAQPAGQTPAQTPANTSTPQTTTPTVPTAGPQVTIKQVTTVKKAAAPGKKVKKAAVAKPAPPPPPPWKQFPLNSKTTMFLDFTESNPDMVLSMFSRTAGITIVKDPSFKSPLTVTSAKNVHLGDAFEILNTVLGLNGFELQKQGHLLVVAKKMPPAPPAPPPAPPGPPPTPPANDTPVVKVYDLKNANASQVARVINEVFTPQQLENIMQQLQNGGGMPPGGPGGPGFRGGPGGGPQPPKIVRASYDDYSNKVVVNAPPKYQDDVKKLIDDLDKSTEAPLQSEVFHLTYIDADEAVDAITDALNANAPLGRGAGKQDQNQGNFFFYNPYGDSQKKAGSQSAIAIKASNSVIVSATEENMKMVEDLIDSMDKPTTFIGTTFVMHLQYAKATDVATLLNQAFTARKDNSQQDNPFFVFYSDQADPNRKKGPTKDYDDQGRLINVRDLTGKVNVIADPNTNNLIVVTAPSNIPLIQKVLSEIDKVADQVMIQTVIVEANLNNETKLGVEWNFVNGNANGQNQTGTQGFGIQSSTTPNTGLSYTINGTQYKAFLNAVQNDNRFKVLDTPRIFTSNNVKSTIDVSQKVPYITEQSQAVLGAGLISNYSFLPVGVILTVTPRVTASGEISMDIDQSADDLQGFTSYGAPIVNHREATTTVSVKNGDTVILGGIIQHNKTRNVSKIPVLGDIPLIGNIFRSTDYIDQDIELMVLMTPIIVKSPEDAQKLREQETGQLSKESQGNLKKTLGSGG